MFNFINAVSERLEVEESHNKDLKRQKASIEIALKESTKVLSLFKSRKRAYEGIQKKAIITDEKVENGVLVISYESKSGKVKGEMKLPINELLGGNDNE